MDHHVDEAATKTSKARPKRKRSLWWRILRVVLIVLAVPIVLALGVVGYLHTASGKARVRAVIAQRVGEKMNGSIEVGRLDYSLGGKIELGEVKLRDASGAEVIRLGGLRVVPSWNDLLQGRIVIHEIAVDDVEVHLVKDADGGSNLKRLFKPTPEAPEKKKFDKRISIEKLHIGNVGVSIEQPDGTKLFLSEMGLDGSVMVAPATKTVDVELSRIGASVRLDKGEKALQLSLTDVTTGLSAHLADGKGKVTLHPLAGHVALTLPGREVRKFDVSLAETGFDIGDGSLDASLGTLLTGIVALGSVEVRGNVAGLDGSQRADIVGLHVEAAKVNELLGKDILATDIDVETHIAGPRDTIALDSRIKTQGGDVALKGTIGVADRASPSYDLLLTLDNVSTAKLLSASMNAVPVEVGHVTLAVKGKGREVGAITTDAKLHIEAVKARGVPIDDVALDAHLEGDTLTIRSLSVRAVGQDVTVNGTVRIPDKHVDLSLALEGDLGEAVAKLKAAGIPLTANLPRGLVSLRPGDVTVKVKGDLNGALVATVDAPHIGFAGGSIGIDARADLVRHDPPLADGKKVEVESLDAHVTLAGLRLSSLAALRQKKLPDMDGTINGRIDVSGTPTSPKATIDLGVRAQRNDKGGPPVSVGVKGQVDEGRAHLVLSGKRGEADLLAGDIVLPLRLGADPKGLDPSRPIKVSLSIPKTSFSDLAAMLPPAALKDKVIPTGDLALQVALAGTAATLAGTFDLDVHANALPGVTQRLHLAGTIGPEGSGSRVATATDVWLDDKASPLAHAVIDARSARPLLAPGPKSIAWNAGLDVAPTSLSTLAVPNQNIKSLGGTVSVHADFHGDLNDASGGLKLEAHDLRPGGGGPVDATVTAALESGGASFGADVDLAKAPLLRVSGKANVEGKGLVAGVIAKRALDPSFEVAIDLPKRTLGSLSALKPPLASLPGNLAAHFDIHGTKSEPLAHGTVTLDGFTTLSGEAGKLEVGLDADKETVAARVNLGGGPEAPVRIEAHATRAGIAELSHVGGVLPLSASVHASGVDLKRLLPTFALEKAKGLGVRGQLDWNMDFTAKLEKTEAGPKLREPALVGSLALDKAEVDLPNTKRTYKDVTLKLTASPESLRIDELHATESDLEVKDRSITLKGNVLWHELKPTSAEVDLSASKWLLFGTKTIGLADAPRGTLSIQAHATTSLDAPIKKIVVDISSLEVLFRDRFDKAHQPEDVHVGDLVFLGQPGPGGAPVSLGKLPVPQGVLEKIEEERKARAEAATEHLPPPRDGAPPPPETGLDVEVSIAKGAHLLQSPIDLYPEGRITIQSRKSGRKIRGRLNIDKGELSLGGAFHSLATGSLTFDDKNPAGYLDLTFAKPARASALRGVANASAGDSVLIHMFGPISDRRTVLGGAGSPGALYDLLSVHNVGRERFYTEPDMPISNSVQFPQHENLLVLSFLSVNLPHLIFLDRVTAWADPYDAQASYGKLEHYQAEREGVNGKVRFLATKRPPTAGQSEAEVELDYLFANTPQLLFGAGLAGGSRGGGGPGVFIEWSSKE